MLSICLANSESEWMFWKIAFLVATHPSFDKTSMKTPKEYNRE